MGLKLDIYNALVTNLGEEHINNSSEGNNKIDTLADSLSKVNGTNDALLSNMLVPSNLAIAPMFNSHSVVFNGSSNWLDLDAVVGAITADAGTVAFWFKLDADQTSVLWKCNSNSVPAQNYIQIYYFAK